jgi:hypothetical protein
MASETATRRRRQRAEKRTVEVTYFDRQGRPTTQQVEAECYGALAVHKSLSDFDGALASTYSVTHIGTGACYRQRLGKSLAVRLARELSALPITREIESNPDYTRLLREWAQQFMATLRRY